MEALEFKTLKFEKKGPYGILTLNRPEALNAINAELINDFSRFLDYCEKLLPLRVLCITGSGEKAFAAGADIKELSHLTPDEARGFAERGQKVFRRLEVLPFPVIAAVNGYALGGGCELAMACDFIFASQNAKFGVPEVALGVIPGFGGTQRLARYVGWAKAREMIYTGQQLTAEDARAAGLVNRVVELKDLLRTCEETVQQILARGPIAVANAKKSVNQGYDLSIDEGLQLERDLFSDLFRTQDQKEGTKAFLEKRSPHFSGK